MTVIEVQGAQLRLAPAVEVDLRGAQEAARGVSEGIAPLPVACPSLVDTFVKELLPGWSEEWLTLERERWQQIRVHALESLAQRHLSERRYLLALEAAMAASAIDPIRESAQRLAIETLLAEGNIGCAVKRYKEYQAFLLKELKVAPSPRMTELIRRFPVVGVRDSAARHGIGSCADEERARS